MKKMRIILWVVVSIVILVTTGFFTVEALGDARTDFEEMTQIEKFGLVFALAPLDTSRVTSAMPKMDFPGAEQERMKRATIIGVIGGVVALLVILLAKVTHNLDKIAEQQKKILENQGKGSEYRLKKVKQPTHIHG